MGNHNVTAGALLGSGAAFASDLTRTLTVGANNHNGVFSGSISNSSGAAGVTVNLVKVGTGTQILSGIGSYSGLTLVAGGVLTAGSASAVGAAASGLTVVTGATFSVQGGFNFGAKPLVLGGGGSGGSGALRNDSGSSTFTGPITLTAPTTIRAGAGRLTLGGAWNTADNALTFDAAAASSIIISNALGGAGTLTKTNSGTLTLYGTHWLMGAVAINQGTLGLGANASLSWASGFSLAPGAVLDVSAIAAGWSLGATQSLQGYGAVSGTAFINGTLRPGGGGGALLLNGRATLAGETVIGVGKTSGAYTNDLLVCAATLTLGGTLMITNIGTDLLVAGDAFAVLAATNFSGAFATITLPLLGPNLAWDISGLGTSGTIRVISTEPSTPPSLSLGMRTGSLALSWPTDYFSYILTAQTNPAGLGLGTNWTAVPGVSNNFLSIPIDPGNGSVFYRLLEQ